MALVGIVMGSDSDAAIMKDAAAALTELGISYEATVASAHRTPDRAAAWAKTAADRGIKVISFDSAIGDGGRIMHLDASSTPLIGAKQVQMIAKTLGGKGEVAILSAASPMKIGRAHV